MYLCICIHCIQKSQNKGLFPCFSQMFHGFVLSSHPYPWTSWYLSPQHSVRLGWFPRANHWILEPKADIAMFLLPKPGMTTLSFSCQIVLCRFRDGIKPSRVIPEPRHPNHPRHQEAGKKRLAISFTSNSWSLSLEMRCRNRNPPFFNSTIGFCIFVKSRYLQPWTSQSPVSSEVQSPSLGEPHQADHNFGISAAPAPFQNFIQASVLLRWRIRRFDADHSDVLAWNVQLWFLNGCQEGIPPIETNPKAGRTRDFICFNLFQTVSVTKRGAMIWTWRTGQKGGSLLDVWVPKVVIFTVKANRAGCHGATTTCHLCWYRSPQSGDVERTDHVSPKSQAVFLGKLYTRSHIILNLKLYLQTWVCPKQVQFPVFDIIWSYAISLTLNCLKNSVVKCECYLPK